MKGPPPYPLVYRLFDLALSPFMRLISGAPFESPQETHGVWNVERLPYETHTDISPDLCAQVTGTYDGVFKEGHGPLFHFPILGGWKEYVVVEAARMPWYVGWIVDDGRRKYFEYSRLALTTLHVRLLKPAQGVTAQIFGIDADGVQVPVRVVGEGRIGDGKFPQVRLL
jgi:hypothetical protein